MIDWKKKLTSRKFWVAIIGFVTALLITFGVSDLTIEKVTGLLTAFGTLIAYMCAEAYVDGKREGASATIEIDDTNDESDSESK